MKILLTNDDGVHSNGLQLLRKKLASLNADINVCAPLNQQSGTGHAITIFSPLRESSYIADDNFKCSVVNGSPADCVKLGISTICKTKPDIVISGINPGGNMGTNVIYSGTVAAAMEALMLGCCAVAVSIDVKKFEQPDYTAAADFVLKFVKQLQTENFPLTVFNINLPNLPLNKIKGVKVTAQGNCKFFTSYEKREDPMRRNYYWLTGELEDACSQPGTDYETVSRGYISVTPLKFNMTDGSMNDITRQITGKL